jgi:Thioesterase-like superfamily
VGFLRPRLGRLAENYVLHSEELRLHWPLCPLSIDLLSCLALEPKPSVDAGTALRPEEGLGQRGNGTLFTSAVTSHTLWFHRPFRTDDWLLLRQHSPPLAHGRSFGRGDVPTKDGTLVASFGQEALLRMAGCA